MRRPDSKDGREVRNSHAFFVSIILRIINAEFGSSGSTTNLNAIMLKNTSRFWFSLLLMLVPVVKPHAQSNRAHIGLIGGLHSTMASYSDLNKDIFDSPKGQNGLAGGLFLEFELGQSRVFSIRPEVMFLSRGFKIEDIKYKEGTGIGNLDYTLNAQYTDIRVPLICNFGSPDGIRPYIYLAPVLGLVRGGEITAEDNVSEYKVDVSDANMASTYFAGQAGVGVKFPIHIGNDNMHIGLEANYELGFTDTYADKEKNGKARSKLFFPVYHINGTRKFSGFEVMATVSVPFSIFKSSGPKVRQEPVVYQPVRQEATRVIENPCFTLEEILDLVEHGQSVAGKTICAVEQINFEYDKSTLSKQSYAYLDKIATFLINTKNTVEIKGHTDNRGTEEYNLNLSKERAEAVYNYLLKKGVSPNRISYSYYGLTRPVASNDTEAGRRQNRRVEFEIK